MSRKILFSSHVSSRRGGAERSLFEIVKHIKLHTHFTPVVILPGRGELYTSLRALGCRVYIVESNWWTVNKKVNRRDAIDAMRHHDMYTIKEMVTIIEKEQPFLCVTNTIVMPWLAYAAALTNTRHAWFLREFGTLDQNLEFSIGVDQVYRTIDHLSDAIFVNSHTLKQHYSALLPTHSKNIIVSFPYVEAAVVSSSSPSPFSPKFDLKLVCIGQVQPSKGQLEAVKALGLLFEKGLRAQLFLVGAEEDAGYVKEIKEYANKHLPAGALVVEGFRENPMDYVYHADISIVCSVSEAFGRVVVESMLAKTPVVGKNAAGVKEIIRDTTIGRLYDDVNGLAKALTELHNNRVVLNELSINAYKFSVKHFSISSSLKGILSYLETAYKSQQHANLNLSSLATAYGYLEVLHIRLNKQLDELLQVKNELTSIKSSRKWRLLSRLGNVIHQTRRLFGR